MRKWELEWMLTSRGLSISFYDEASFCFSARLSFCKFLTMWIIPGPASLRLCKRPLVFRGLALRSYATKTSDPLRILFCGSDDFSIASLKALHAYKLKQPERISSIDVVCRPGKKFGRGLKQIREGSCYSELMQGTVSNKSLF
jgi:hypothetical protein